MIPFNLFFWSHLVDLIVVVSLIVVDLIVFWFQFYWIVAMFVMSCSLLFPRSPLFREQKRKQFVAKSSTKIFLLFFFFLNLGSLLDLYQLYSAWKRRNWILCHSKNGLSTCEAIKSDPKHDQHWPHGELRNLWRNRKLGLLALRKDTLLEIQEWAYAGTLSQKWTPLGG